MNLDDLVVTYQQHLYALGNRPRGIDRYMQHLRGFLASLPEGATVQDLTAAAVRQHMRERAATCAAGTVIGMLTSVRSFCCFLMEEELLDFDPTTRLRWPKRRRPLPSALTPAERRQLFEALREPKHDTHQQRWYLQRNRRAVYLMLYAGLRLEECAALLWRDIDLAEGCLYVRDGKGGKMRLLSIHAALRAELEQVRYRVRPEWAVAGAIEGRPISPKALAHIFEVWLPSRGVVGIHAHRLRHTFATEMLRAGAGLAEISEAMGHTDISTTQIYLQVDFSRVKGAIDRLPTWA